ncbi:MAG: response regulator [Hassallia sp. WJT32-NPBG1]|jgi:DNA-binding response OmpR family regulator|nr:response regulator [Hassallia sp. WJT32-NPBG1]
MNEKENTRSAILLIEQDDETRPLLVRNLRNAGYQVIVALDEEGAIERTIGGCHRSDIILLNQVNLSIEEFLNMGRRIRQGAGLPSHTPIVVIAERYGADLEGKDVQVGESEYVSYPEDAQQLMNLLHRLCSVYSRE